MKLEVNSISADAIISGAFSTKLNKAIEKAVIGGIAIAAINEAGFPAIMVIAMVAIVKICIEI